MIKTLTFVFDFDLLTVDIHVSCVHHKVYDWQTNYPA